MNLFSETLDRLKFQLRVSKDQEVAAALGMSKTAFSERKKRSSIPEREVLELCKSRPDLDSHYILTGIESVAHARLDANQKHISQLVDSGASFDEVRESARSYDAKGKQDINDMNTRYYKDSDMLNKNLALLDEFIFVPQYDVRASAGSGLIIHDESIVNHLAFKREWLLQTLGCNEHEVLVIEARGDSMSPTINDADLLLLNMRAQVQRNEGVYVIQLDGSLLIKRLRFRLNSTVEVISDNPRYGSETLTSKEARELTVLGRVMWHGRKF